MPNLIKTIPQQMHAVIKAKGGPTKILDWISFCLLKWAPKMEIDTFFSLLNVFFLCPK